MMERQRIYFMALCTIIVVVAATSKGSLTDHHNSDKARPAPWYDCSRKQPGNYPHSYDCTRFITCDAGLKAIEFDCPPCAHKPEICTPQNRLIYNRTLNACLGTDEAECDLIFGF